MKKTIPKGLDIAATVPQADRVNAVMAFSVRSVGRMSSPHNSLSFLEGPENSAQEVTGNLGKLGARLGIDARTIVTCRQIHGDGMAVLDRFPGGAPDADAMIAERPGIFPAIRTADCLPILILEPRKRIAAAIHAGWRGTTLRITRKVVAVLKKRFRCEPSNMIVGLGPAIGACCYEVDDTVLTPLRKAIPRADRFIEVKRRVLPGTDEPTVSYRLDLTAVNRYELKAEGVPEENILEQGLCTCCNPQLFFSYRRDGALAGRHISLTGFRE
ncbi:MAG: peptidoglycan editing factor PgeF [Pseudomonadota bacterium]